MDAFARQLNTTYMSTEHLLKSMDWTFIHALRQGLCTGVLSYYNKPCRFDEFLNVS